MSTGRAQGRKALPLGLSPVTLTEPRASQCSRLEALLVPGGSLGHLQWGPKFVITLFLKDCFESKFSICTQLKLKDIQQPF